MFAIFGCAALRENPYGIQAARITDFDGYAEFVARHRDREQTSKRQRSRTGSEETIFEETLHLETDGYVFHPNLLEFALGGTFGLLQERFKDDIDGRQRTSSHDGSVVEFDLDANLFTKRSFPLNVSAHRRRGLSARPFLPSLETTTTNYSATWQYVSDKTPTLLHFGHTRTELSPLYVGTNREQDGLQEDTVFRFETGYNFTKHNALSFEYEHEEVEEEPFVVRYDADELTLDHKLEFGPDHTHRLDSEVNHLDQTGTIAIKRLRWRENLRLRHTEALQSFYQFEWLDRTRGSRTRNTADVDERSLLLSAMLQHELYRSLTSSARVYFRKQSFDPDLDITRIGGNTALSYRKINRWGILHASYNFRAERDEREGGNRSVEIIDESQTFRDPEPIVLPQRNVQTSSIVVRAQDRVTLYQRGADFSVHAVGDRVEIRRMASGRILDEQTVLVQYTYRIGGTYTLRTTNHTAGIRQAFYMGLTPYYRYEWQEQTIAPRSATGAVPEDITAHVVGVEYQKKTLRLFAEYEDRESTINPLQSTRLGASYTLRYKSGAQSTLRSRWTETHHGGRRDRDVELFTAEARHRHPITKNLTVEGAALYRNGEDSLADQSEGIDLSLAVEWLVRNTEVRVSVEHNDYEDTYADNNTSVLFVQVRRNF